MQTKAFLPSTCDLHESFFCNYVAKDLRTSIEYYIYSNVWQVSKNLDTELGYKDLQKNVQILDTGTRTSTCERNHALLLIKEQSRPSHPDQDYAISC